MFERYGSGRVASGMTALLVATIALMYLSCERKIGWGMLLWASDKYDVQAGAIVPVFSKSNIKQCWEVGRPEGGRYAATPARMSVPLSHLELYSTAGAARKAANTFAPYAPQYAETRQDGLPIRETPDNTASRVYRLRNGEVIKILERVSGTPPVSTTGDPLPGAWFLVLTQDGARGYCFSYRLALFTHARGPLPSGAQQDGDDIALKEVESRVWSAEVYKTMLDEQRFDIDALQKHWGFTVGEQTGIANIYTADIDKSFHYTAIRRVGERRWRFEGAALSMELAGNETLLLDFTDENGKQRRVAFEALPTPIDNLIAKEKQRRDTLIYNLYRAGPVWESPEAGILHITESGTFAWDGIAFLQDAHLLPAAARGRGDVDMRYHIGNAVTGAWTGAIGFRFDTTTSSVIRCFLYRVDAGELTLEYVNPGNVDDAVVTRRSADPVVIYFQKQE